MGAATVFAAAASATRLTTHEGEGEVESIMAEFEGVRDDPDAQPEAEGDTRPVEFRRKAYKEHFKGAVDWWGTVDLNYREDELMWITLAAIDTNEDGNLSIDEYNAFVDL